MKRPVGISENVRRAREQAAMIRAARLVADRRYEDALAAMAADGVLESAGGRSLAGDIHLKKGRPREALEAFDAAVRLAPMAAAPHSNRAVALLALERHQEALAALDTALRLRSDYAGAYLNRGNVQWAMGNAEAAAVSFTRALNIDPSLVAAHIGRARALRDMGKVEDGLAAVEAALKIAPANVEAARLHCDLLYAAERYAEDLTAADELIARNGNDATSQAERARALFKLERFGEGLAAADWAASAAPDNSEIHVIRGALLNELGRFGESLQALDQAAKLGAPDDTLLPLRVVAGASLVEPDRALADFEKAIAANPDSQLLHSNRALLRLATGDWPGGWEEHERRLQPRAHPAHAYVTFAPAWKGESLAGKRLLLYAEQGLGDSIQFVRFLPLLAEKAAAITLVVPQVLVNLFAASFPGAEVVSKVATGRTFDYQASLMSLPAVLGTTLDTLPRRVPYIVADSKCVARWRERIGTGGFRVGIVWQGGRGYRRDASRSMPLAKFAPLAGVPGVRLISLQAKVGLEQLDGLPATMQVERLGGEIEDNPDGFREMAAAMSVVDLMIMSDTGPTHLAGALGRPVWVLLPRDADWRWMHHRDDSPVVSDDAIISPGGGRRLGRSLRARRAGASRRGDCVSSCGR